MTKADIYQTVTDSIIAMLEAGVKPWAPGHNAKDCGLPVIPTRANGQAYRGINVALLWGAAEMKGYRHQTWMTFNQAKELGGCVRKGEKATPVVYWGTFKAQADDTDEGGEDGKARMFAKGYSVFNIEQIDGLPARFYEAPAPVSTADRIKVADAWAVASGADIRHGGSQAYFSPKGDYVQLPPLAAYFERERYYSTLAHELTHWTGHESRLAREFGKRFGNQAYAFEELVAELGAAFACARLGIETETREDHASYLASWLKVLKSDKRAIFTAASKAQAACDYLFDLADKADFRAVERPSVAADIICLPDLSGLSSAAPVEDDNDTDEFLEDAVSRGLGDLPHFWAYPGSDSVLAACGSVFVVDDTNLIAATDDDPSKGFLTLRVHDDMPDYRELLETHPHVFALSMDRLKEVHDEHGMTFDLVDWLKANVGPTAAFGKHQSDDAVVFDVGAGALASVRHGKRAIMVVTDCHAPMLTQKTSDFLEYVAKVYFFKDKAKAALFSTFWS